MIKLLLATIDHSADCMVTPDTPTRSMEENIYIGIKDDQIILLNDTIPAKKLEPLEAINMIVIEGKTQEAHKTGVLQAIAEIYKRQVA